MLCKRGSFRGKRTTKFGIHGDSFSKEEAGDTQRGGKNNFGAKGPPALRMWPDIAEALHKWKCPAPAMLPAPLLPQSTAGTAGTPETNVLNGEIDASSPVGSAVRQLSDANNSGERLPALSGAASGEAVERLRAMIGERQDETVEILRGWLEDKEESV